MERESNSEAFTPSLLPTERGWRPPRYDLTPADLQEAGWVVQPHFDTDRWVARKENQFGGCEYTASFRNLETLIDMIRTNKIRKEIWNGKYE